MAKTRKCNQAQLVGFQKVVHSIREFLRWLLVVKNPPANAGDVMMQGSQKTQTQFSS